MSHVVFQREHKLQNPCLLQEISCRGDRGSVLVCFFSIVRGLLTDEFVFSCVQFPKREAPFSELDTLFSYCLVCEKNPCWVAAVSCPHNRISKVSKSSLAAHCACHCELQWNSLVILSAQATCAGSFYTCFHPNLPGLIFYTTLTRYPSLNCRRTRSGEQEVEDNIKEEIINSSVHHQALKIWNLFCSGYRTPSGCSSGEHFWL